MIENFCLESLIGKDLKHLNLIVIEWNDEKRFI
uniref:Uncharacterized protein n=1 Tax=Rhizophora mucronata TaxID=61149 RepID=A0A2P2J2G7_RHIMU